MIGIWGVARMSWHSSSPLFPGNISRERWGRCPTHRARPANPRNGQLEDETSKSRDDNYDSGAWCFI